MTTFPPNSELVAINYLRSINYGPSATPGVGTTIPADTNSWLDGFIQVAVVGGTTDHEIPTRMPVIQLDVYVPSINSSKPQWGKANAIAEYIVAETYADHHPAIELNLGGNYASARVQSIYLASEPRRMFNDPGGFARYTFDIVIAWVNAA